MLKNQAFIAFFSSFLIAAALMIAFIPAEVTFAEVTTQRPFLSPQFKFSISLPEDFVAINTIGPSVALALKQRDSDFPTFNIVVEPQTLARTGQVIEQIRQRVIEGYRQVGLTDAQIVSTIPVTLGPHQSVRTQLGYSRGPNRFVAIVTTVPTRNYLYTLTFTDVEPDYSVHEKMAFSLEGSFMSGDDPLMREIASQNSPSYFWVLLLVILTLLAAFFLRNRRRRMPS